MTTASGRVLYGGRGIEPDVAQKPAEFGLLRARINEAAFFFVRQLVAGKVAGLESYKIDKQDHRLSFPSDTLLINDKVLETFKQFAVTLKESGLSAENVNSAADYARTRIREELATATHSNEAGAQVLLEVDPQVRKALEVMPEARRLSNNCWCKSRDG